MKKFFYFLLAIIFAIQGWSQVINTFPWNEGFETGLTNWTQQYVSGTNSWTTGSSASQIASAQQGTQFALFSHNSTGNTTKLVSPVFDISALTNPTIFFWYTQTDWGGDQNTIKVYYRSDTLSTTTWTEILYLSQNTPSWSMVTLPLPSGSSTYQIAFEGYDDYGYPIGLDNLTLLDLTCPPPSNLVGTNPTTSGFDLGWTDATGTLWNIQYMLASESDWTNATTISGVTNPYTFTTLNSSTAYKVRVQTDCSTEQSLWTNHITFSTSCGSITTFPWSEGFETSPWDAAVTPGNALAPLCWININGGYSSSSYIWRRTSTASYIHSGTGAAQMYTSSSYPTSDWLISPPITLTGGERLRFWAKGYNTYIDNINVKIFDITTNTSDISLASDTALFTEIMPNTLVSPTVWTEYEINLSQYVGDYRIAFVRNTTGGYYLNLDDVSISAIPACSRPSLITSSSNTQNSIDLSWTNGNTSDASWYIYYAPTGTSTFDSVLANSNPYTLSGLSASTGYDIYMRTDCGTELSEASNISTFYTSCGSITSFPWNEGFEVAWAPAVSPGNLSSPTCWTNINKGAGSTNYWSRSTSYYHSGAGSAQMYTDNSSQNNDWLITPLISLTGNERLRFWTQNYSATSAELDEISIWISDGTITTIDTTNMGQYDSIQGFSQIYQTTIPIGPWQQHEINLSQYSGDRYIAFVRRNTPDNGWYLRLDDVEVSTLPQCNRPTNVTATNITTTDAEISWVNGNQADASWWIYYKQSGTTTYDSILVNSNPYTLSSLLPSSGYDVYVVTDCSTELSEASQILNFRTLCADISTLPYLESFDSYGTGSSATSYPPCWSRNVTTYTNNYPYISSTSFSTPGALYFYAYGDTRTVAVCNPIDSTVPINTLAVEFKMRYSTVDASGIQLGVMTNPNDFNTFVAVGSPQVLTTTDTWEDKVVFLSNYTGTGRYIALAAIAPSGGYSRAYIDNFKVDLIPSCPSVYGLNVEPSSTSSVSVNWNDEADEGDGYVIAYASNLNVPFDPATATNIISVPTGSPLPYIIPGFNPGDSVWVAVQRGCGGAWTNTIKVILPTFANTLPLTANFEDTSLDTIWTITNGTQTNKWFIGVPGANDSNPTDGIDERGLYVSSDNGTTATYDNQSSSVVFLSTIVAFDNSPSFQLSFDWLNNGESGWDGINVYLLPLGTVLTPGTLPSDQYKLNPSYLCLQTTFQTYTKAFSAAYSNSVKQLVFCWRNDGSGGTNPPAKIDNISLVALSCGMPYGLATDSISYNGTDVYLHWTEPQESTSWILEYQQTGATTGWTQVAANSNPFTLTGLNPGTSYQARVRSICNSSDTSAISNVISFQTACVALTVPTLVEGFNTIPPSTCWERKTGLLPATGLATLSSTTSGWYSNTYPIMPNAGNHAYINIWSTSARYWLITPSYNLGDGTTPAQIEFDVLLSTYNASGAPNTTGTDDKFAVVVSTDNGLTWDVANAFIWSNDSVATPTRIYNNLYPLRHIILPLFDQTTSLPYTGNVKIAFYGESTVSNADNYLHIDNFEIIPFATCQRPTSLGASAVSSTTANISFQENGTATTWQYVLTNGTITDPNNGTPVSTTTNPIPLTGLTPQTQYTIWVRSDCTTETSVWSTPLTFVTEAPPATVPYSFDFENQTEALAWRNLSGSVNNWAIGQAAGNGPSTQNANDSTAAYISNDNGVSYAMNYGYIYAYGYRDIDFGTTPASYSLTFDWKCQGYVSGTSAYSGLIVYLRDITDTLNPTGYPSNVNDNLGLFAQQSTWQTEQLPLDNVSGVKRLIFFYFDSYYNNQPPAAIDNISIVLEPCPRPFDVAVSGTTTTTTEVSWNHPGATSYIVSYRTNTTGSTLTDLPASTSPLTISGLTAGTSYLVAVRAICNGDTTIYSETVQFTTPCADGAISSFPWIEGFESGLSCWTQEYVIGTTDWTTSSSYNSAHAGSGFANFYNTSGEKTRLVSPLIDISGLPTPYVSFWHMQEDWAGDQDELKVFYRVSQDSAWRQLVHYTSSIYVYQYDSLALPNPSSTYQLAFEGMGDYGYGVALDDVKVYDPNGSACAAPTNLSVSGIQNTTATVSWIPAGTESAWQVRLGTTGTPVDVANTTYSFPATLTAGTHYTYYVRANCGTNYSAWVQDTFTTTAGHQVVQVTTIQPTAITQTNATFQGTYVQGTDTISAIGFEYKTTAATTWTDQVVTPVVTPFTYVMTTLTANTNYKVRAYAVTATDGRVYGDTLTFATPAIVAPTVTTLTPNPISYTSATFQGTIVEGSEAINARGFEYKLPSQTWQDANIISATGTNNITASVTTLQQATTYDVRAYARTASATTYGLSITFNTLNQSVTPPTVATLTANSINDRSATLRGTITAGSEVISNQGFEWKATSATTWTPVTVVPVNDTIIYLLTGIEPETNYEFKAFATTATATTFGTVQAFVTLGLNEIDGSVITVMMYPNPASQETKLVVTGLQGEVKITISDVQGRIINTINTRAHNNKVEETINVSDMANGVYYVRLQNDQISRTQKLIVK